MEEQLVRLCETGDLTGAQQLLELNPNIYFISYHYYKDAFWNACVKGHLHVAQWLLENKPDITDTLYVCVFNQSCICGQLHVCQWLLEVYKRKKYMITNDNFTYAFSVACSNGALHVAQWLLYINPHISVTGDYIDEDWPTHIIEDKVEKTFRTTCSNGHLLVCQWLLQVFKEKGQIIDISAKNDEAFIYACRNRHLGVAQWLQSLKPYLYEVNYNASSKRINYKVRNKEEQNWEKRKYGLFLSTNKEEPNLLYQLPTDISKMVLQFV